MNSKPKIEYHEHEALSGVLAGLAHYKRTNAMLLSALVLVSSIALISSVALTLLMFKEPENRYFAATPDLHILPLIPLVEPTVTDAGLKNWVAEVVSSTLSLNFLHYQRQLSDIRTNYTEACFNQIVSSLESSGNLEYVKSKRLNAGAVITQPPIIVNRGVLQDTYVWDLQFPVRIAYESSMGQANTQENMVFVRVVRVASTKHPLGIAINQLILN